jgi:hypothetical protein
VRSQGSVYTWCGCRDQRSGRRLGSRCPRHGQPGHGSWYFSMEASAGSDGRRHRIRRGGFPDQAAARAALDRLMMPPPGSPADQLMTVGQWLRHWLVSRNAPRFSTLRSYASHIRLYLDPCLGQILLADLRTVHVQAMLTAIARQRDRGGLPGHGGHPRADQGDAACRPERRDPRRLSRRQPCLPRRTALSPPAPPRGLDRRPGSGLGVRASLTTGPAALRPTAHLPVHLAERRRLPHPGRRVGRTQRRCSAAASTPSASSARTSWPSAASAKRCARLDPIAACTSKSQLILVFGTYSAQRPAYPGLWPHTAASGLVSQDHQTSAFPQLKGRTPGVLVSEVFTFGPELAERELSWGSPTG